MVKQRYYLISAIILVFFIAACGGGGDDEEGLQSVNNTSVSDNSDNQSDVDTNTNNDVSGETVTTSFSNQPAITTNELVIPQIDELDGTLFFVQGDMNLDDLLRGTGGTLYMARFDGTPAQPIADRIFAATVTLSPDKRYLAYTASEGRRRYEYSLEIATGEIQQLAPLSNQFGFVSSWSPDLEWFTVTSFQQGVIVTRLDGSNSFELDPGSVLWTSDGQLIYYEIDNFFRFNNPNPPQLASIQLIDPNTQESTVLDIEFDPTDTSLSALIANVEAAGVDVAPSFRTTSNFPALFLAEEGRILSVQSDAPGGQGSFSTAPQHCLQWEISYAGGPNPEQGFLVDVPDTAFISDIYFEDEAMFYQRWYFPDCQLQEGNLVIALERVVPGEDRQVVSDDLYPGVDINLNFLRTTVGRRYAVSPDQQYAAWISGSLESRTTRLNVTHIESGETINILKWVASNSNSFLATEALNTIFWVPAP